MPLARGDVGPHGVERDARTAAPEKARQEERGPQHPPKGCSGRDIALTITRLDMAQDTVVHSCWVCGAIMREIKCKIVCPHCGYTRDCSDP